MRLRKLILTVAFPAVDRLPQSAQLLPASTMTSSHLPQDLDSMIGENSP